MVSFEIFVKAMPPSLSELKVLPSFCFALKIPDDRAVTILRYQKYLKILYIQKEIAIKVWIFKKSFIMNAPLRVEHLHHQCLQPPKRTVARLFEVK